MPAETPLSRLLAVTRAWPAAARLAVTMAVLAFAFVGRHLADPWLPSGYPFLISFPAILVAATLFGRLCGTLAVLLSALYADWAFMQPVGSLAIADPRDAVALLLFALVATSIVLLLEALHDALARLRAAHAELAEVTRARALLLREFRHRTRNDLGSLVGLLHLRARVAPSAAAREGLREAAGHALALARVHSRLAESDALAAPQGALVDTRDFVEGLCADIRAALLGDGLRPVALVVEAEAHALDAERAVPLGLVLNEALTNALKYAFPDGRAGRICVRLRREGASFELEIADDGIGAAGDEMAVPLLAPAAGAPPVAPALEAARGGAAQGLGTRLLRALAAQLRGDFQRGPGLDGQGTLARLRFPVAAPGRG